MIPAEHSFHDIATIRMAERSGASGHQWTEFILISADGTPVAEITIFGAYKQLPVIDRPPVDACGYELEFKFTPKARP